MPASKCPPENHLGAGIFKNAFCKLKPKFLKWVSKTRFRSPFKKKQFKFAKRVLKNAGFWVVSRKPPRNQTRFGASFKFEICLGGEAHLQVGRMVPSTNPQQLW